MPAQSAFGRTDPYGSPVSIHSRHVARPEHQRDAPVDPGILPPHAWIADIQIAFHALQAPLPSTTPRSEHSDRQHCFPRGPGKPVGIGERDLARRWCRAGFRSHLSFQEAMNPPAVPARQQPDTALHRPRRTRLRCTGPARAAPPASRAGDHDGFAMFLSSAE